MKFRFEQTIGLPRDVLFSFYGNPGHLALLHREDTAFRLLHHDGALKIGNKMWFEINVARMLPVVLGFEQTIYEPPHRFSEDLIHGPFTQFTHIHEFDEATTGTIVRDLLEVELPPYYGGELAMRTFIAPVLRRAFQLRGATLQRLAQSGEVGSGAAPQPARE